MKRVSSSLSAKREGIKCHIYIHAESERELYSIYTSLGACVPVREPTTTRNEPAPPNNALCVRFIAAAAASARSGTRFPESKKEKNIKRSPKRGCMDFELGKTSVKMAFRSLCSPDFITYRLKCVFEPPGISFRLICFYLFSPNK
jgi:hypothetical protein